MQPYHGWVQCSRSERRGQKPPKRLWKTKPPPLENRITHVDMVRVRVQEETALNQLAFDLLEQALVSLVKAAVAIRRDQLWIDTLEEFQIHFGLQTMEQMQAGNLDRRQ